MVEGDHHNDRFLYAASHGLGAWKLEIDQSLAVRLRGAV